MIVLGIDLDRCIKSVLDGDEEWWVVIYCDGCLKNGIFFLFMLFCKNAVTFVTL